MIIFCHLRNIAHLSNRFIYNHLCHVRNALSVMIIIT